jgi:hypothetical protein
MPNCTTFGKRLKRGALIPEFSLDHLVPYIDLVVSTVFSSITNEHVDSSQYLHCLSPSNTRISIQNGLCLRAVQIPQNNYSDYLSMIC